jgi:hypothetical protein
MRASTTARVPAMLAAGLAALALGACCSQPKFTPAFWNDAGTIQYHNNCYNYSNNHRTDTFAQPGRAAGAMYAGLTCADVLAAAAADGIPRLPPTGVCPNSRDKIALVVAPGIDFHWYRLDTSGFWTHKPGGTQATNVDNSGNPITNPETANRGMYTDFCGYFCSCSDAKEGNGHEKIN